MPADRRTQTYFRAETVHLPELLTADNPVIRDRTFEDCEILGPAIIGAADWGAIVDSRFQGDLSSVFIEIPEGKPQLGVIVLERSVFRRCRFRQIGVIGTKTDFERMKRGFLNA